MLLWLVSSSLLVAAGVDAMGDVPALFAEWQEKRMGWVDDGRS